MFAKSLKFTLAGVGLALMSSSAMAAGRIATSCAARVIVVGRSRVGMLCSRVSAVAAVGWVRSTRRVTRAQRHEVQ